MNSPHSFPRQVSHGTDIYNITQHHAPFCREQQHYLDIGQAPWWLRKKVKEENGVRLQYHHLLARDLGKVTCLHLANADSNGSFSWMELVVRKLEEQLLVLNYFSPVGSVSWLGRQDGLRSVMHEFLKPVRIRRDHLSGQKKVECPGIFCAMAVMGMASCQSL